MWAFRKDQPLSSTLFSASGGVLSALEALVLPLFGLTARFGAGPLAFHHTLGPVFFCWAISLGVLFLGALRTSMVVLLTAACLCLSFLVSAIGEFANAKSLLLAIGG